MNKFAKLFFIALLVSVVSACATAPGKKFAGLETPANDQCDIYLYRTSSLTMVGRPFDVTLDDKPVGTLYNASYLHLRIPEGSAVLKVLPGGVGKVSDIQIQAKPGESMFFQYEFVTGLLTNIFFAGSSIQPRTQEQALLELKELNSAK